MVRTKVGRELGLVALFGLAAVVFTWPLARTLNTALPDLGDPVLNAWIINWDIHALFTNPLRLFHSPMFYPAKYSLAFSENMLAIALVMAPFRKLGLSPVATYNLASIFGFTLGCYGASVLARAAGRSLFAGVVTGLGFGFCQFFFDHLPHLQITWSGWIPLILAGLLYYWQAPSAKRAALPAAAFLANALTNIYFMLFATAALAITLAFLALAGPRRSLRAWIHLGVAFVVAGILLYPVLRPYQIASKTYNMKRGSGEVGSGAWIDWIVSTPRSVMYHQLEPPGDHSERRLFPGVLPIAMTIAAFLLMPFVRRETPSRDPASRPRLIRFLDILSIALGLASFVGAASSQMRLTITDTVVVTADNASTQFMLLVIVTAFRWSIRLPLALTGGEPRSLRDVVERSRFTWEEWCAAIWIVTGIVGSFGMSAFFHRFLYRRVFVYRSMRAVGRWAVIAYAGLVPLSARGIDLLLQRRAGVKKVVAAAIIALLVPLDVMTYNRWEHIVTEYAPVYQWIVRENVSGPILELPMEGDNAPFFYLYGSTLHFRPSVNGTSGFESQLHYDLRVMEEHDEYNDVFYSRLERNRVRYLIVHGDRLSKRGPLELFIRSSMRDGRLALVRRLEGGIEGDYVFALTKTGDEWKRLAKTDADVSGMTDLQKLDKFFAYEHVYNNSTFGIVDFPIMNSNAEGPLTVSGWMLSPNGIASVDVALHSRKHHYRATMTPRPEVNALWPWYGNGLSGFKLVIPKRPKGTPRDTDVQVSVTDRKGKVTVFRDLKLNWN